jgi:hypothetical protein
MDIAMTSMILSQNQVMNDFGTAMLSKSLDLVAESGDDFVKMMEQSVNPSLGQNIDIRL